MRRLAGLVVVALLAGCGSDAEPPAPVLVPGGGITGNAKLSGYLNVYVIDARSKAPIMAATVNAGGKTLMTDATGLARFGMNKDKVSGPAQVSIGAASYINQTWYDVDAPNLTVALAPQTAGDIPTATVKGTVDGWSGIPLPPMGHIKLAIVAFSLKDLTAPEAALYTMQGTGGGTFAIPRNGCFAGDGGPLGMLGTPAECAYELKSRTGAQALYVMVFDYDTNGSFTNRADDSAKLIGFGFKRGMSLTMGATMEGVSVPITASTVMNVRTSGGTMKIAGLDSEQVIPVLVLGEPEGVIPIFLPPIIAKMATPRDPDVPPLSGELGSAWFDFILTAAPSATMAGPPSAISAVRGFKLTGTPTLPEYLALPTTIAVSGSNLTFGVSTGAVSYFGALRGEGAMADAWQVVMLDPARVTYPMPNPADLGGVGSALPVGKINVNLSAADVPGFNPREFKSEDGTRTATRVSTNTGSFTR